jgi:acyl dehydratase
MTVEVHVSRLKDRVGDEIGVSDWIEVGQHRIDQFAEATEDRQWIHLDSARAAAESPFKSTIAHGFLTLSLISVLLRQAVTVGGCQMAINYGLNRVRFFLPVLSGSRLRGRFVLRELHDVSGGVQVTWAATIERDTDEKPCCVAEWLVRYYPDAPSRT